jgi:hypothetical protein
MINKDDQYIFIEINKLILYTQTEQRLVIDWLIQATNKGCFVYAWSLKSLKTTKNHIRLHLLHKIITEILTIPCKRDKNGEWYWAKRTNSLQIDELPKF